MSSSDDGCCGCSLPVLGVGYLLGLVLAVVISWSLNHAIGWASLHGILSWGYVIYYAVTR